MKKLFVLAMVMGLVLAMAGAASATYLWGTVACTSTTTYTNYGASTTFGQFSPTGTNPQGFDNTKAWTAILTEPLSGSQATVWQKQYLATSPDAWIIQVWAGENWAGSTLAFRLWSSGTASTDQVRRLKVLYDATGTYTAGTILANNIAFATGKSATAPLVNIVLPAFKTAAPKSANSGIYLSFETVPEPGSMVAMLSGLVGLAGYAIRRRK